MNPVSKSSFSAAFGKKPRPLEAGCDLNNNEKKRDGVHWNGENYSTAVIWIEKDQVFHPEELYFYKMEHL